MDIEKITKLIDHLSEPFYFISGSSSEKEVFLKFFSLASFLVLFLFGRCAYLDSRQPSKRLRKLNLVIVCFLLAIIGLLFVWRGAYYLFDDLISRQVVFECPSSIVTENQMIDFQRKFKRLKETADSDDTKSVQALRSLASNINARLAVDVPSTNGATNKTSALKCLIAMEKEGDLDAGSAKKAFNDNNADEQNMAWMVDRLVDKTKKEPKDFKLWRENLYARANAIQDTETLDNLDYIDRNYPINLGNGGSQ